MCIFSIIYRDSYIIETIVMICDILKFETINNNNVSCLVNNIIKYYKCYRYIQKYKSRT